MNTNAHAPTTILAALLLLSVLHAVAAEDYTHTTNNGTITITGYTGSGGAVTIPSTINGLPVNGIGDYAFSYASSLIAVAIPNSVTSIGGWAFYDCSNLTSVAIPDSVTNIGTSAFLRCASLASATIGSGVTSISDWTFAYCQSLTQVTIGNQVTTIGTHAFSDCTNLTSVTIPKSVTRIAGSAFYWCTSLTSVYFQGNAPDLDSDVFNGANKATIYYLPGTTGWNPQIQTSGPSFGVRTNQFGFTITGTSGLTALVEACTNLAHPAWLPVGTNTITSGSSYFSDPQWTNYIRRFYRVSGAAFGNRPTVLWNPQVQTGDPTFGVRTNRFGFTITGTSNLVVVVEACTNLANPSWSAVGTNTLTNGSSYFSDSQWTNYTRRFYRLRSP